MFDRSLSHTQSRMCARLHSYIRIRVHCAFYWIFRADSPAVNFYHVQRCYFRDVSRIIRRQNDDSWYNAYELILMPEDPIEHRFASMKKKER